MDDLIKILEQEKYRIFGLFQGMYKNKGVSIGTSMDNNSQPSNE